MTSTPLVTIGIPTFNRADGYLRQCLQSALDQTYTNLEIIVSDNCSDDNTDELVGSFGDERIRYFKHPQNIGANNNFNYCVNEANGLYFLMLHDDDLIDPDFIEACIAAIGDSAEVGIVRTGTRVIDADNKVLGNFENLAKGMAPADQLVAWFEG